MGTHTHSGPDLLGVWGGVGAEVRENIHASALQAARQAIQRAKPARLSFAQGATSIPAINRRAPGKTLWPNRLGILFARSLGAKQPFAGVVFYAMHPVIYGNPSLLPSADFIGPLLERLEAEVGGEFLFFNGALGNVNPPRINPADAYDRDGGTFGHLQEFNRAFLKEFRRIARKRTPIFPKVLEVKTRDLEFELEHTILDLADTLGLVETVKNKAGRALAPVSIINLGADLRLLTIPGELFKEYESNLLSLIANSPGIVARKKQPAAFFLGLCNDSLGYFVPPALIRPEGGIEETFILSPRNGEKWLAIQKELNAL